MLGKILDNFWILVNKLELLDSFFIKMSLISWVRLCNSLIFSLTTVCCMFLTASQTEQENVKWLVVSYLLLYVSLLST